MYKIHFVYHSTRGSALKGKPDEDLTWFATYPVIPRVGDYVGMGSFWFRVDEVFLYSVEQCKNIELIKNGLFYIDYIDRFLDLPFGKSDASIVKDRTASTPIKALIIAVMKKARVKPQTKPEKKRFMAQATVVSIIRVANWLN